MDDQAIKQQAIEKQADAGKLKALLNEDIEMFVQFPNYQQIKLHILQLKDTDILTDKFYDILISLCIEFRRKSNYFHILEDEQQKTRAKEIIILIKNYIIIIYINYKILIKM